MKQCNFLITAVAIGLTCTAFAKAKPSGKPTDFQKLQFEYHNKANNKIAPLNERYKDELESLLKKKMRSGSPEEIAAIQKELKSLEANPALLLEEVEEPFRAKTTDLTLADFEGDWLVKYSDGGETRFIFDSEGNVKSTDSNGGRSNMKLNFDPKTGKFVVKFHKGAETFSVSHGKLKAETWWGDSQQYPDGVSRRTGTGKKID